MLFSLHILLLMYSRPFFPESFEDNPSLIYFSLQPMLRAAICATYLFTVNPSVLILKLFITDLSRDVSKVFKFI